MYSELDSPILLRNADAQMIMKIYANLTEEQEKADALKLLRFTDDMTPQKKRDCGKAKLENALEK